MTVTPLSPGAQDAAPARRVIALVMALFFAFGFCTVLVDTLVPKLKALFSLSYTEVMLTQFCFFGAYFIVSLPAARLVTRTGYLQSVTLGLVIMALGCAAFTPAAEIGSYPAFLAALFTLAAGVTIVQVAVNPLATTVGDPARASARLTLAQAFNSLATTVGPLFGAAFILKGQLVTPDAAHLDAAALAALRQVEGRSVQAPFLGICAVLIALAVFCWTCRGWAPRPQAGEGAGTDTDQGRGSAPATSLLGNARLMFGTLGIFLYVGAEVAIGSMVANYLMQGSVLGIGAQQAGSMVAIYWGLAMVGRFVGAALLGRINPGLMLSAFAVMAGLLASLGVLAHGQLAAVCILAIGFCNSIMFPTIFSLAVEDVPGRAAQASGLLSMAIVGGAVVPVLAGAVADAGGLHHALAVPVVCYVGIALFGLSARQRPVSFSSFS